MTVIYSKNKVDNLVGAYADPDLFDGNTEVCNVCYTDNQKINEAYAKKGIEVRPLTQPQLKKKITKDQE